MAFSSRFSFWEQKVKEENPPGKNLENEGLMRAQSVSALDPGRGFFQAKSPPPVSRSESTARFRSPSPPKFRAPVKVPERFKSPEPRSNIQDHVRSPEPPPENQQYPGKVINGDANVNGSIVNGNSAINGKIKPMENLAGMLPNPEDQGVTRKKVVKVVRRIVRKVIPTEEEPSKEPEPTSIEVTNLVKPVTEPLKSITSALPGSVPKGSKISTFSFKHDTIKSEEKDDISLGLACLIGRGRTKEPRSRIHKEELQEMLEPVERKEEKKQDCLHVPKHVKTELKPEMPLASRKQQTKAPGTPQASASTSTSTSIGGSTSTTTIFKTSQSSICSPPSAAVIPAPRSSSLVRPECLNTTPKPPPALASVTKSTAAVPTAVKSTLPAGPSSTAGTKSPRLLPIASAVEAQKHSVVRLPVGTLSSPSMASSSSPIQGSIPFQPHVADGKDKEVPLSPTEEAQIRLMRIFSAPVISVLHLPAFLPLYTHVLLLISSLGHFGYCHND